MVWTAFNQDHGAIAAANLPIQFGKNKPLIKSLVAAFAGELNPIEETFGDLFRNRWLANASGIQLDRIGEIVGLTRSIASSIYLTFFGFASQPAAVGFGQARMRHDGEPYATSTLLPDTEYRALLYAKIARNNSHGTTEDVIQTALAVFDVNQVIVQQAGIANISINVGRYLAPSEAIREIAYTLIPTLAGVGFTINQFNPANVFGFANQGYKGFGQGSMASDIRTIVAQAKLKNVVVTNPVQFATGDGATKQFQLYNSPDRVFNFSGERIFLKDWQGNRLLSKSARTNVIPALANHSPYGGCTVTQNAAAGPDGTANAAAIYNVTTAGGETYALLHIAGSSVNTYSIFAKPVSGSSLLTFGNDAIQPALQGTAVYDLSAGVVTRQPGLGVASILPAGNGYYRCVLTYTEPPASPFNDAFIIQFASGTAVANIYGPQVENGSDVTSVIATGTGSATVSADYSVYAGGIINLFTAAVNAAILSWTGSYSAAF